MIGNWSSCNRWPKCREPCGDWATADRPRWPSDGRYWRGSLSETMVTACQASSAQLETHRYQIGRERFVRIRLFSARIRMEERDATVA